MRYSDPGAIGVARQHYALRRWGEGALQAYVIFKESTAVMAIRHEWSASAVTLTGAPIASLRQITRSSKPTARMIVRFQEGE